MLFDLEDYKNLGIIGTASMPSNQIYWPDAYTTFRATRDAYKKTVREYYDYVLRLSTIAEFPIIEEKRLDFAEASMALEPIAKTFWNAMLSLPLAGQLIEGDRFDMTSVGKYDESESYLSYPYGSAQNTWWNENYKNVAIANAEGEFIYTEMSQAIYDDYKLSLIDFQSKAQEIMIIGEGGVALSGYVPPVLEAWDSYPQLSGYVRDTNNLSIRDAVVRLVDLDGVNHDVVTDENGFYIFSKEMFYNTIAFDHTAPLSTFNMFLLENTIGSADYSFFFKALYDKTNPFQSSFFGAENDRGLTWPMSLKMDRSIRRNFKLEFITDYSNYPSFSGYVKDGSGNPIENALVFVKDPFSGFGVGQFKKTNGDIGMKYTYNDFGVSRSILTDASGFYEYTSQMVGEWFNNELYPSNKLGGHSFNDTFVNTIPAGFTDGLTGIDIYSNDFIVYLIPKVQVVTSDIIDYSSSLYNPQDYASSRFEYALNPINDFFYKSLTLNTHYDINVNTTTAVGNEVRAENLHIECTPNTGYYAGEITTTGGYFKAIYKDGSSDIFSGQINKSVDPLSGLLDNIHIYACDYMGRASGYITRFISSAPEGSSVKHVDFSELSYISFIHFNDFDGAVLDVSGLSYLKNLWIYSSNYLTSIEGLLDLTRLEDLQILKCPYLTTLDLSKMAKLSFIQLFDLSSLSSTDISQNKSFTQIYFYNTRKPLDFSGLTKIDNIGLSDYNMNSDDVDSILSQLDSTQFENSWHNLSIEVAGRTSDSDSSYDSLISKGWNINTGSVLYDVIEAPKNAILYIDTLVKNKWYLNLQGSIQTTTGYFRINTWKKSYDNEYINVFDGGVGMRFSKNINIEFDDTFGSRPIEIYSTDQYGRASGDIVSISLDAGDLLGHTKSVDFSALPALTYLNLSNTKIESLDLKSNTLLTNIIISYNNKLETIDFSGLSLVTELTMISNSSLLSIIGLSELINIYSINLDKNPELTYQSLISLAALTNVTVTDNDKYDSTHIDNMLSDLDSNGVQNGSFVVGDYIGRTSTSDLAYDSLVSKGWSFQLGSEFFAPYTPPVKGFFTLDWQENNENNNIDFFIQSSTGYFEIKSANGEITRFNSSHASTNLSKGIAELWSCDSHGRPQGDITNFVIINSAAYIKEVNFSNLTNISDLDLTGSSITSLDLNGLTNLTSLTFNQNQKIEIVLGLEYLSNLNLLSAQGCPKLTSLNVSGMNALQNLNIGLSSITSLDVSNLLNLTQLSFWNTELSSPFIDVTGLTNLNTLEFFNCPTLTSADVDSILGQLDENGHENGVLTTNYVARTSASDVMFDSLSVKNWTLYLGSELIGPNTAPVKGYFNFKDTLEYTDVSFYIESSDWSFRVKYPNGIIETKWGNGWVYFQFDKSIPATDRIFEVWGVDQYSRPKNNITRISYLDKCSSIDVKSFTELYSISITSTENNFVKSLDFSGLSKLTELNASSVNNLESVNIAGCTSLRNVNVNSAKHIDIDGLLTQLDQTGSSGDLQNYGFNYLYANNAASRTHFSDMACDSLISKYWELQVVEPAGDDITFSVHANEQVGISLGTSTGYAKMIFQNGTQYIFGWGNKFYEPQNNGEFSDWQTFGENLIIRIVSCTIDGTPSGEIRYFNPIIGIYNLNLSLLTKVKSITIPERMTTSLSSLSFNDMTSLEAITINGNPDTILNTIDLSGIAHKLKYLRIQIPSSATSLPNIIGLNSCNSLVDLYLEGISNTSVHLSCTLLTWVYLSIPSLVDLDLQGCTSLNGLYIQSGSITSLDLSTFTNIESISITCSTLSTLLLNSTLRSITLYDTAIQQLDLSSITNLGYLQLSNCNSLNSVIGYCSTYSSANVVINYCISLVSVDLSNGSSLQNIYVEGCNSLTSLNITNHSNLEYINIVDPSHDSNGTPTGLGNVLSLVGLSTCFGARSINLRGGIIMTSIDFTQFNNLRSLVIRNNDYLTSIVGLSGKQSLYEIAITECDNMNSLDISNSSTYNLTYAKRYNSTNSAVSTLNILGCSRLVQINIRQNLTSLNVTGLPLLQWIFVGGTSNGGYDYQLSSITGLSTLPRISAIFIYYLRNFTTLSVTGLSTLDRISIEDCALTSLDISGSNNISNINIPGNINTFDSSDVDNLLIQMDATGKRYGYFNMQTRQPSIRTSLSNVAYNSLVSKGWSFSW